MSLTEPIPDEEFQKNFKILDFDDEISDSQLDDEIDIMLANPLRAIIHYNNTIKDKKLSNDQLKKVKATINRITIQLESTKVMFGKHKGKSLYYLINNEIRYIRWCQKQDNPNHSMRDMLETYRIIMKLYAFQVSHYTLI